MIVPASTGNNTVPVIARLVAADKDTISGSTRSAGLPWPLVVEGRPRLLSDDDEAFVAATATTRPAQLGQPFTWWSIRKLAAYLHCLPGRRPLVIGREPLRTLLARRGSPSSAPLPGRNPPDLDFDAKLGRMEYALSQRPERDLRLRRVRAFVHRPGIRLASGWGWAEQGRPDQLPATYHRTHGITYFHSCYLIGDDLL
ncbi:hypothetical protein [Herbidospora cretacea]|uniref:hypothetical protein n=1 Tax=Herbidospora cretacea TaxID=28444 RepID=UPI0012DD9C01|nr:hypothetical protein [Herbidospora cretacea]